MISTPQIVISIIIIERDLHIVLSQTSPEYIPTTACVIMLILALQVFPHLKVWSGKKKKIPQI